jgi:hypothetical protein
MADEAKTPDSDAAGDVELPFPLSLWEDVPGMEDTVKDWKDAYQKEQNRVGAEPEDETPAKESFANDIHRQVTGLDKAQVEEYNEILKNSGFFSEEQREELLDKYRKYNTELEGKSYEELASIYKEVYKDTIDYKTMHGDNPTWIDKQDLKTHPNKDTPEELKAEVIEAMRQRDFGRVYDQNLADQRLEYEEELDEEGIDTYEELIDEYNRVWKLLHPYEPAEGGLRGKEYRSYEELREATIDLNTDLYLKYPQNAQVRIEDVHEVKPDASSVENAGMSPPESARDGEIEMPPESARDGGPLNYLRNLSGPTEEDELEKQAPPADKPESDAASVEPTWSWGTNEDEAPVDKPDASSATERAEPPGSAAAPIGEGEASSRLIGREALPTEDALRDEAFSGEEKGEGAPEANAAAAPATAAGDDEIEMPPEIEIPPDSVEQASADDAADAVGEAGAAIGAEADAVEASGPGETIEEADDEAILVDPPAETGAAADVVEPMEDPAADAAYEGVETPPSFTEDALGGGLGEVGEEEVVESMNEPVVEDVDPWA